jgi:Sulfite exporter TauE/SafE.
MTLTMVQYGVLLWAGFVYGLAKTGITGLTALLTPVMLAVLTPGQALGLALPILLLADSMTVWVLRKSVSWRNVFFAVPWAVAGVLVGWRVLTYAQTLPEGAGDTLLRRLIAVILIFVVISGVAMRVFHSRSGTAQAELGDGKDQPAMGRARFLFASAVAFVGGTVTMLANNSGPAWVVYLMMFRLDKFHFLGTVAWLILILNAVKMPLAVQLGYVTADSLQANVLMIPTLLAGLYFGRRLLVWIPQKVFDNVVQILALLGALYLLFLT